MRTSRPIRALRGALIVAAIAAPPAGADPPSPPVPTEQALAGLDDYVAAVMGEWRAGGLSLSIVKDGKVVLSKGYGVRDLATGAPMTSATMFPIQSETKSFTAFTVGLLVDEGKLSWDAPVATYIPGFRMHDPLATLEVTLRDFLSHRSGLPHHSWLWISNDRLTRAESMARMPHLPSVAPIRTTWRYANMGYVTAARAVELAAGLPWEQLVEERIFVPLGMTRTTFSRQKAMADPDHAGGSMFRGGRWVPTPMQGTTPLTNSTGGIYSTADDMAKWMLLHLDEGKYGGRQIIQPATLLQMHAPQVITNRPVPPPEFTSSAAALGWYVESYRGETIVEHGGGHWGVSSVVGLLPARELGVSIYVNQESDLPVFLMLAIFDRFLGGGSRDWPRAMLADHHAYQAELLEREKDPDRGRVAGTKPGHPLEHYVGIYEHAGFGTVEVTLADRALQATYDDDRSPLRHWHYDTFVPMASFVRNPAEFGNVWAMSEGMKLQFLDDFDGRVSGLRLSTTVEGVTFRKRQE